jgi:hypothetical protein
MATSGVFFCSKYRKMGEGKTVIAATLPKD